MVGNGRRTPNNGPFPVYTNVIFSCNFGYELIGPADLACDSNGQWSLGKPACLRVTGKNEQK